MSIGSHDAEGIVDILYELHRMGWVTERPRWSIQQSNVGWHGVGAKNFVVAVRDWEGRTRDLPDLHHTEEVAYCDTCAGGYFSLEASIAHHASRVVYSCSLSFQLVGVPLDANPILHLREVFDVSESNYFRPRDEQSVKRHRYYHSDAVRLELVGYLVTMKTASEKVDWVTGIVAKNPYLGRSENNPDDWPELVAQNELLICDLRSHHPLDNPRDGYKLFAWEVTRTSDVLVTRMLADW